MAIARSKENFVSLSHKRRSIVKAAPPVALTAFALCLALAGCATSSNATSGATASAPTQVASTATPQPASPQPTPLPAKTFTTYTNTTYGYSISYPRNWSVEGTDASAQSLVIFNYNPRVYQQPTSAPPLLKIEIDTAPNPSHLSPLDFFKQSSTGPGEPAIKIQSSQATTLADHDAERIIWTSSASQYPIITFLISKGDTMLLISQSNVANGQPSPVFTQMLASLTITG
jgi:hypothetical protein